jgi:hypothetical protein
MLIFQRRSTVENTRFHKACREQERTLQQLLETASGTAFGRYHRFSQCLHGTQVAKDFAKAVPLSTYEQMHHDWWRIAQADEPDITWPGKIPYYALSSGTSNAATKYIPVTAAMLRMIKKASRRMFYDLRHYDLPAAQLTRRMLMIGGSTRLTPEGDHHVGDLSGIMGLNCPKWLERHYRPGHDITDLAHWDDRIAAIAEQAPNWDIGFVVGNPMWVQLVMERVIQTYGLDHIHQIWPNLKVMVHGGVYMAPYKANFDRILGEKIHYIDNYTASEGFFGCQQQPEQPDMTLGTDYGIYFEFVPFDATNFDEDGNLLPTAEAIPLQDASNGQPYALLISTCSGAWRYLLGDVIQFTDIHALRFKILGRNKQYLSVAGEHLSIDNLNDAVARVNQDLHAEIQEFTVAGLPDQGRWMHQWWVSSARADICPERLAHALDAALCALNDDYAVESRHALSRLDVALVPRSAFTAWLAAKGKLNGQAKVPRVLKGVQLEDWLKTGATTSISHPRA